MGYSEFPDFRSRLEGPVVRRAWADPAFRQRLLDDPRAALAEELGAAVPDGVDVEVVEERPDRLVVVLPVDMSGFKRPSVDAMMGRPPRPAAQAPAARASEPVPSPAAPNG